MASHIFNLEIHAYSIQIKIIWINVFGTKLKRDITILQKNKVDSNSHAYDANNNLKK